MATNLRLNASADVGGRFSGPDLGEWGTDGAAFWCLVLFAVLVLVVAGIARSIR